MLVQIHSRFSGIQPKREARHVNVNRPTNAPRDRHPRALPHVFTESARHGTARRGTACETLSPRLRRGVSNYIIGLVTPHGYNASSHRAFFILSSRRKKRVKHRAAVAIKLVHLRGNGMEMEMGYTTLARRLFSQIEPWVLLDLLLLFSLSLSLSLSLGKS